MILILFRHGHKGLSPMNDPDLTAKGFEQAEILVDLIEKSSLPKPTNCWYSAKIRTQQTLLKAIEKYKTVSTCKKELDLKSHAESAADFRHRIQKFCSEMAARGAQNEVHFACTHYDWIEEALTLIDADKDLNSFEFSNWSPGQFLIFEILSSDKNEPWKVLRKGVLS